MSWLSSRGTKEPPEVPAHHREAGGRRRQLLSDRGDDRAERSDFRPGVPARGRSVTSVIRGEADVRGDGLALSFKAATGVRRPDQGGRDRPDQGRAVRTAELGERRLFARHHRGDDRGRARQAEGRRRISGGTSGMGHSSPGARRTSGAERDVGRLSGSRREFSDRRVRSRPGCTRRARTRRPRQP